MGQHSNLCHLRRSAILLSHSLVLGLIWTLPQLQVWAEPSTTSDPETPDPLTQPQVDPQTSQNSSALQGITAPASPSPPASGSTPPQLVQLPTPFPSPTPEEADDEDAVEEIPNLPSAADVIVPEAPPELSVLDVDGDQQPELPPLQPPELATEAEELTVPQSPLQVRVERTEGLTLQDALDLAVERNPDVQRAELQLQQAQAALDEVLALYLPTASTSLNYTYQQPPSLGSPIEVGDSSRITGSLLRLDYTFLDSGFRDSAQDSAREAVDIADLSLDQIVQTLRLDVATAYYQLQQTDSAVAIAQASVETSEANLADAEARERAGLGTRFDVLTFETELANNRQQLLVAQNDRRIAQRALVELLNTSVPLNVTAIDPVQPSGTWGFSLEDSIVIALQNREELEIERRSFAQAQDQARNAITSIRPQLNLFATFDGGADLQIRDSISTGYSAGATFSWPFFDGGAARAQARGFELEAEISTTDFIDTRNFIQNTVEDAFLTLESSREQIETAKVAIESAQESLRLSQLRFQAGVGTQTEVITAESSLTEARGNLASAVTSYNIALVQLQRAVSGL